MMFRFRQIWTFVTTRKTYGRTQNMFKDHHELTDARPFSTRINTNANSTIYYIASVRRSLKQLRSGVRLRLSSPSDFFAPSRVHLDPSAAGFFTDRRSTRSYAATKVAPALFRFWFRFAFGTRS